MAAGAARAGAPADGAGGSGGLHARQPCTPTTGGTLWREGASSGYPQHGRHRGDGDSLPAGPPTGSPQLCPWLQLRRWLRALRWQPGGGHLSEVFALPEPLAAQARGRRPWRPRPRHVDRRLRQGPGTQGALLPTHGVRWHLLAARALGEEAQASGPPAACGRGGRRRARLRGPHRRGAGRGPRRRLRARAPAAEAAHRAAPGGRPRPRRRGAGGLRLRLLSKSSRRRGADLPGPPARRVCWCLPGKGLRCAGPLWQKLGLFQLPVSAVVGGRAGRDSKGCATHFF
mmetsp:Transcript_52844/g.153763  ORF Transcript_52844/g.153763 Transcript_52844/m.153763 type:complete len:286 (+) Transcript_52844:129-986(+)